MSCDHATPDPAPSAVAADELEALATRFAEDAGAYGDTPTGRYAGRAEEVVRTRAAELRAAAPTPAAVKWEPVEAADVQIGDEIEVHLVKGGGSAVITGPVTRGGHFVTIADAFGFLMSDVRTIRRRVRRPMPEPEAPAVVRHAGRMLGRPDWSETGHAGGSADSHLQWVILSGKSADGVRKVWLTWPEVLALDPATNPVLVDLGGGA